jgi:vancomycin permeability regulator SanA
MIRWFFRLIYRLIALAVLVFVGTAVWIVFDGLNDHGDKADAAVVPGNAILRDGMPAPILRGRLDRAIELYQKGDFPLIIVSGATKLGGYDEPAAMSNYLVEHQVPVTAVVQDKGGVDTFATGADVARIMHTHRLHSVMVVTDYYHITRMKLALEHAGVKDIDQTHSGVVTADDALRLTREVVALYYYIGKFYFIPAADKASAEAEVDAEQLKEQAQIESEKIKQSADHAKDKIHDDMQTKRK